MALDDKQIRKALLGELSKDAELEIYQEFLLPSSKARADIVTVGETMIKQNLVRMVVDECSLEEKRVIRKLICLLFRKYKIKDCYKNNSLLQK